MNDRLLRACRREPVDRPPVWIMRQAGRYLPEYRALRERVDFLTLCRTPELAVEASLQPLRRFALDAAIVFSDIMVPVEGMGVPMTFAPGPRLARPIRDRAAIDALRPDGVAEAVPYVGEAIRLLRRELDGRVPVIGFCGAPFTLASYMVEGRGHLGFPALRTMMEQAPHDLERLLETLAVAMTGYLEMQIAAGAQVVQVFDSSVGMLSPAEYRRFARPALEPLLGGLRREGVPVIYFAFGGGATLEDQATLGADVLGIDWHTPLAEARVRTGGTLALQGNLDPRALFASPAEVTRATRAMLDPLGGAPGHIVNLGHGILPDTPIASVEALIAEVARSAAATLPAVETRS